MTKIKYGEKTKKGTWKRGTKIPTKPKHSYKFNKETNKRQITLRGRIWLSYKAKTRYDNQKAEITPKGEEYLKQKEKEKEGYVRIIFRFQSSRKPTAHSPLYLQAVIDGKKKDIYKMREILQNEVQRLYGSDVAETGSFYEEDISIPEYQNYQIRYRRSERENWKIWK